MRIPETGFSVDDRDSFEQTIAELKGPLFQPTTFCLNAVDQYVVLHETAHPASSGMQPSTVEAT
ncbi:MAG: hypothetical protein WBM59_11325, partial [Sedimenticolaceae bacterium]